MHYYWENQRVRLLDESPCKRHRIFLFVIVVIIIIIIGFISGDLHVGCGINETFKRVKEGWGTKNGTLRQPSTVLSRCYRYGTTRSDETKRNNILHRESAEKKTEWKNIATAKHSIGYMKLLYIILNCVT